ncbi:hypothetical protein FQZ97_993170 [compost metagenome]
MAAGVPDEGHDVGRTQVVEILGEVGRGAHQIEDLAVIPAFQQGDAAKCLLASHQLGEQTARRGARRNFVAAGLDIARLAGQPEPAVQQDPGCLNARERELFGYAACRLAGLNLHVQGLLLGHAGCQSQRFIDPPHAEGACDQQGHQWQHEHEFE